MLRKTVLAACAVAALGLVSPTVASARGGGGAHGVGGFHGGGFHGGGFHGGGFHGGGFHGGGYGGVGLGLGLGLGYGAFGWPYYAYNDYYDYGGCYIVREPVRTPYGVRIRPVQVCS